MPILISASVLVSVCYVFLASKQESVWYLENKQARSYRVFVKMWFLTQFPGGF